MPFSSLADQATCTLNIVFTPSAVGARSGTLTATPSAANNPLTFSLSGTGMRALPVLGLAFTPLVFGNQLVKTSSNTTSVVLTNSGTGPLTVTAMRTTGDFNETTNCSVIAIGAQCSVAVGFTPTQTGPRSGQLSITDNAAGSPQVIALSGTGTDFALQAAAGSQLSATMAAGATAVYNLAVAPVAGFTGMVALTCTGAPAGSSCMPSAASVNVTGAAVPITVSVTTAAATLAYPQYRRHPRMGGFAAVVLPLGTFALIAGKRRRRLLSGLFCLVLLVHRWLRWLWKRKCSSKRSRQQLCPSRRDDTTHAGDEHAYVIRAFGNTNSNGEPHAHRPVTSQNQEVVPTTA